VSESAWCILNDKQEHALLSEPSSLLYNGQKNTCEFRRRCSSTKATTYDDLKNPCFSRGRLHLPASLCPDYTRVWIWPFKTISERAFIISGWSVLGQITRLCQLPTRYDSILVDAHKAQWPKTPHFPLVFL